MITGKCGYQGCQYDIVPAKNQAQFNRNKGVHLRVAHGLKGAYQDPEYRNRMQRERVQREKGVPVEAPLLAGKWPMQTSVVQTSGAAKTEEEIKSERRRQYGANYRRMQKLKKAQEASGSSVGNGAVLKFICPDCGCRVWTTQRT